MSIVSVAARRDDGDHRGAARSPTVESERTDAVGGGVETGDADM